MAGIPSEGVLDAIEIWLVECVEMTVYSGTAITTPSLQDRSNKKTLSDELPLARGTTIHAAFARTNGWRALRT